VFFI
jgi:hypothetical protein